MDVREREERGEGLLVDLGGGGGVGGDGVRRSGKRKG